jgi:hypothetical protein
MGTSNSGVALASRAPGPQAVMRKRAIFKRGPARDDARRMHAVQSVRQVCSNYGVDATALSSLLSQTSLEETVRFVFGQKADRPSRSQLRALVFEIESILDLSEPLDVDLAGPLQRSLRLLRAMVAAIALAFSAWTVLGAIVNSQNALAERTSPLMTLGILIAALIMLALLEAAHIGAVALSTADVSTLKQSHPRVYALHRFIDTKHRLESYLAARQVGVVLIVFVIAEVTRTVGLATLPGTSVSLPSPVGLLFQVGAPGALMVLVIGQVTPQILTARRPAAMMNLLPMAAAFHATRFIGYLGLAAPASWLVSPWTATERIASAPRERYVSSTMDVDGHGVLMCRREVRVGLGMTEATTETTILFHRDDRTSLPIGLATVPTSPGRLRVHGSLLREGERLPALSTSCIQEYRLSGGQGVQLGSTYAPRAGTFQDGDILDVTTVAQFPSTMNEDILLVAVPTKLVAVHVVLEHPPAPLPPAELTSTRQSDGEVFQIEDIAARMNDEDGSAEFSVLVPYPAQGTLLRLRWEPVSGPPSRSRPPTTPSPARSPSC